MNMIKKIAITASVLLFVLAQVFSFYIIQENQREKIAVIKEKESQLLHISIRKLSNNMTKYIYGKEIEDRILVKLFRDNILENSALYKNGVCLFNSTSYEFENNINRKKIEYENVIYNWSEKKIGDKRVMVSYDILTEMQENYIIYHVLDITSIFETSQKLMLKEMLVSFVMSAGMAVLLVIFIKKITKPLQDTNKMQHQLIGSMSHELKTPLTAIQGYSETLLNVKLSEEQSQKALFYIRSESGRLSRLSEKMMELTKLYEPECKIELIKIELKELFEAVKKSVKHELKEKQLTLIIEIKPDNLIQSLDRDLMVSFLINLIKNSIMASNPGRCIYMKANTRGISVEDEGCGISDQNVEKVRKAFYRVDKSRSRKSGNMGLGLSICDQIAKVHHASMIIESQEGKGTKISFIYKPVTDR